MHPHHHVCDGAFELLYLYPESMTLVLGPRYLYALVKITSSWTSHVCLSPCYFVLEYWPQHWLLLQSERLLRTK